MQHEKASAGVRRWHGGEGGGRMSEESTMREEVSKWGYIINSLFNMAIEMESLEQDNTHIEETVLRLFRHFEKGSPDEEGFWGSYCIDIAHPDDPNYKLVLQFGAYFEQEQP